jgi:hypothetical protein
MGSVEEEVRSGGRAARRKERKGRRGRSNFRSEANMFPRTKREAYRIPESWVSKNVLGVW